MNDKEIENLVKESYDLHLHIGPDILPRKYNNVLDIIEQEEGKIKGLALKCHSFPTITGIRSALEKRNTDLKLIGSITLNYFMGGFNPSAVYASSVLAEGPIIVWFSTIHAENFLVRGDSQYEIPLDWSKDPNFKPRLKRELKAIRATDWANNILEKCEKVLAMIKRMDCILATGHLSWQESEILAEKALSMGIKVIITHPSQRAINMPLEVQKRLADKGAYIEHCYVLIPDGNPKYNVQDFVDQIKHVGPEHCILTSDVGQIHNKGSSESLKDYVKILSNYGLEKEDFEKMLIENPKAILSIS